MAQLLKGKPLANFLIDSLSSRTEALRTSGTIPTLALVRVGDRPQDLHYERATVRLAEQIGVACRCFTLEASVTEQKLIGTIKDINTDDAIHGCLLFRPLPHGFDERSVCNALVAQKDVDGISKNSLASVLVGDSSGFAPSTADACVRLLDYYKIDPAEKHVVVVGRSLVVGKPTALLLLERNATVTICHSRTLRLARIMRSADIVVCATGRPRAFGPSCFSAGQTVLDVGINTDADGTLCGDVDFESVKDIVDAITPVPGGIGTLTTSITMEHVLQAAEV